MVDLGVCVFGGVVGYEEKLSCCLKKLIDLSKDWW